jgi:desulfoferrodoxin (superoxide reductase-like protein)
LIKIQVMNFVDGKGIKNVPVMEFTEEGLKAIKPDNIIMLGGNHRREALHKYVKWIELQLEKEEKAMELKQSDRDAEYERLKERVRILKADREQYQYWVVRIYDVGE